MSDLTKFRDHCRVMAKAEHRPECPSLAEPRWVHWDEDTKPPNGAHLWRDMKLMRLPRPTCGGCVTAADRALFAQMAGEVDEYLTPSEDLFGDETAEPSMEGA